MRKFWFKNSKIMKDDSSLYFSMKTNNSINKKIVTWRYATAIIMLTWIKRGVKNESDNLKNVLNFYIRTKKRERERNLRQPQQQQQNAQGRVLKISPEGSSGSSILRSTQSINQVSGLRYSNIWAWHHHHPSYVYARLLTKMRCVRVRVRAFSRWLQYIFKKKTTAIIFLIIKTHA